MEIDYLPENRYVNDLEGDGLLASRASASKINRSDRHAGCRPELTCRLNKLSPIKSHYSKKTGPKGQFFLLIMVEVGKTMLEANYSLLILIFLENREK